MLRDNVFYQHVAVGCGGGDHVGAGLDLIGNNRIVAAVHVFNAADLDRVGARAADVRAHGVEEVCKVNYMRLLGGIFDDGQTLCLDCGKDHVDSSADRGLVKIDGAALKPLGRGVDDSALAYGDSRAKQLKALDVAVNRANAEIAAAGHGNLCTVEAAEQRADEII